MNELQAIKCFQSNFVTKKRHFDGTDGRNQGDQIGTGGQVPLDLPHSLFVIPFSITFFKKKVKMFLLMYVAEPQVGDTANILTVAKLMQ